MIVFDNFCKTGFETPHTLELSLVWFGLVGVVWFAWFGWFGLVLFGLVLVGLGWFVW